MLILFHNLGILLTSPSLNSSADRDKCLVAQKIKIVGPISSTVFASGAIATIVLLSLAVVLSKTAKKL